MTIKGLWDYIKENCKNARVTIPRKSFKGYRVAIDAMSILFRLRLRARKDVVSRIDVINNEVDEIDVDNVWMGYILENIIEFVIEGICPIMVFEQGIPRLKVKKRGERDLERTNAIEEIKQLREELRAMDPFKISKEKISHLKKLESSLKSVPKESRLKAYTFLQDIGIPCIMSKDGVEAERVASMLCKFDYVIAVYSQDGDCIAHKSPITIRDVQDTAICLDSNFNEMKTYEVILFNEIKKSSRMTEDMITDLCIMSGCDYNENIPQIGISRAADLILKYGNIDNIPQNELYKMSRKLFTTIEVLNHIECRKDFSVIHPSELMEETISDELFDIVPYNENIYEAFYHHNMARFADRWKTSIIGFPEHSKPFVHGDNVYVSPMITLCTGDILEDIREFIQVDKPKIKYKRKK